MVSKKKVKKKNKKGVKRKKSNIDSLFSKILIGVLSDFKIMTGIPTFPVCKPMGSLS